MFNCCFYYRISFTFSLVRSLRLAKLVGFSSPPPPLSLRPFTLPTVVHSVFPFSLSLFLSLFFCFCFYDFVLASVTCCLSTPALLPAHIFHRFPSRFSAWAAAAARHVCVCLFYRKLNNCASYKLIMQQLHFVMLLSLVVVVADFIKYLLPTTALSVFEIVLHPYTQFPSFLLLLRLPPPLFALLWQHKSVSSSHPCRNPCPVSVRVGVTVTVRESLS